MPRPQGPLPVEAYNHNKPTHCSCKSQIDGSSEDLNTLPNLKASGMQLLRNIADFVSNPCPICFALLAGAASSSAAKLLHTGHACFSQ